MHVCRFEEEASARAARKAESEARKALWRAEEAQVRATIELFVHVLRRSFVFWCFMCTRVVAMCNIPPKTLGRHVPSRPTHSLPTSRGADQHGVGDGSDR